MVQVITYMLEVTMAQNEITKTPFRHGTSQDYGFCSHPAIPIRIWGKHNAQRFAQGRGASQKENTCNNKRKHQINPVLKQFENFPL
jgi:hypothetical protein